MRLIVVCCLLFSFVAVSHVLSNDYSDEPYDRRGEPRYRYEGLSGKKYQYDLSDPADKLEYQVDLDAQMRDKINPDPLIKMDRDMGNYGGGAED